MDDCEKCGYPIHSDLGVCRNCEDDDLEPAKWDGNKPYWFGGDPDISSAEPIADVARDPKAFIFSRVANFEVEHPDLSSLFYSEEAATVANEALRTAGGQVFIVGGAVRDSIMGLPPKDIDLMVTGLTGDQIETALSQHGRLDFTGKDFGVYRFKIGDSEVEIALPRTEVSTGPGHSDFDIKADPNLSPERDLQRRDYTVNAMGINTGTGKMLDPFGGAEDIKSRSLRLVNQNALAEDPLRIIRGLVANARFGLQPTPEVIEAMKASAEQIAHLPGERLQMEMDKLLSARDPASAVRIAFETGLIDHIAPELSSIIGFDQESAYHDLTVDEHTLSVLNNIAKLSDDPDLRLAALFHDSGKPQSFWRDESAPEGKGGHFYKNQLEDGSFIGDDHEVVGADLAKQFMARLRYPNARQDRIIKIISEHMFPAFENEKGARRFLQRVGDEQTAWDIMLLREADWAGKGQGSDVKLKNDAIINRMRESLTLVLKQENAFTIKELAIGGDDLKDMGLTPGPEFSRILRDLLDSVVENPELNNKEDLTNLVKNMKMGGDRETSRQSIVSLPMLRSARTTSIKQSDYGMTEFQADDPGSTTDNLKQNLDPAFNEVNVGADDITELLRDLRDNLINNKLRKRRPLFHEQDTKTEYFLDGDVHSASLIKISVEEYYYHAAPTNDRARIEAHGLQMAKPTIERWWADMSPEEKRLNMEFTGGDPFQFSPFGIYAFSQENHIESSLFRYPVDIWRILRSEVGSDYTEDPNWDDAVVITKPVSAELYIPYEASEAAEQHWQQRSNVKISEIFEVNTGAEEFYRGRPDAEQFKDFLAQRRFIYKNGNIYIADPGGMHNGIYEFAKLDPYDASGYIVDGIHGVYSEVEKRISLSPPTLDEAMLSEILKAFPDTQEIGTEMEFSRDNPWRTLWKRDSSEQSGEFSHEYSITSNMEMCECGCPRFVIIDGDKVCKNCLSPWGYEEKEPGFSGSEMQREQYVMNTVGASAMNPTDFRSPVEKIIEKSVQSGRCPNDGALLLNRGSFMACPICPFEYDELIQPKIGSISVWSNEDDYFFDSNDYGIWEEFGPYLRYVVDIIEKNNPEGPISRTAASEEKMTAAIDRIVAKLGPQKWWNEPMDLRHLQRGEVIKLTSDAVVSMEGEMFKIAPGSLWGIVDVDYYDPPVYRVVPQSDFYYKVRLYDPNTGMADFSPEEYNNVKSPSGRSIDKIEISPHIDDFHIPTTLLMEFDSSFSNIKFTIQSRTKSESSQTRLEVLEERLRKFKPGLQCLLDWTIHKFKLGVETLQLFPTDSQIDILNDAEPYIEWERRNGSFSVQPTEEEEGGQNINWENISDDEDMQSIENWLLRLRATGLNPLRNELSWENSPIWKDSKGYSIAPLGQIGSEDSERQANILSHCYAAETSYADKYAQSMRKRDVVAYAFRKPNGVPIGTIFIGVIGRDKENPFGKKWKILEARMGATSGGQHSLDSKTESKYYPILEKWYRQAESFGIDVDESDTNEYPAYNHPDFDYESKHLYDFDYSIPGKNIRLDSLQDVNDFFEEIWYVDQNSLIDREENQYVDRDGADAASDEDNDFFVITFEANKISDIDSDAISGEICSKFRDLPLTGKVEASLEGFRDIFRYFNLQSLRRDIYTYPVKDDMPDTISFGILSIIQYITDINPSFGDFAREFAELIKGPVNLATENRLILEIKTQMNNYFNEINVGEESGGQSSFLHTEPENSSRATEADIDRIVKKVLDEQSDGVGEELRLMLDATVNYIPQNLHSFIEFMTLRIQTKLRGDFLMSYEEIAIKHHYIIDRLRLGLHSMGIDFNVEDYLERVYLDGYWSSTDREEARAQNDNNLSIIDEQFGLTQIPAQIDFLEKSLDGIGERGGSFLDYCLESNYNYVTQFEYVTRICETLLRAGINEISLPPRELEDALYTAQFKHIATLDLNVDSVTFPAGIQGLRECVLKMQGALENGNLPNVEKDNLIYFQDSLSLIDKYMAINYVPLIDRAIVRLKSEYESQFKTSNEVADNDSSSRYIHIDKIELGERAKNDRLYQQTHDLCKDCKRNRAGLTGRCPECNERYKNYTISSVDIWEKESDITQTDTAEISTGQTDLHQFTDDTLPDLRNRDGQTIDNMMQFANDRGEVCFIYSNGEIFWGRSIDEIISKYLNHSMGTFTSPVLAGTLNIETGEIQFPEQSDLNQTPSLRGSLLNAMKRYLSPNRDEEWYRPNEDIIHSDEEIYDVKMGAMIKPEVGQPAFESMGQIMYPEDYPGEIMNSVDEEGNLIGSILFRWIRNGSVLWVDSIYSTSTSGTLELLGYIRDTYPNIQVEGHFENKKIQPIVDRYNRSMGFIPWEDETRELEMRSFYYSLGGNDQLIDSGMRAYRDRNS